MTNLRALPADMWKGFAFPIAFIIKQEAVPRRDA